MHNFFFEFKVKLSKDYGKLYKQKNTEDGPWSEDIPKSFDFLSFIDALAGGDITKYDAVYDLNYIFCLEKLLFYKHRDEFYQRNKIQNQR